MRHMNQITSLKKLNEVILFEGIMTFCDEKIRDLMDVKGF